MVENRPGTADLRWLVRDITRVAVELGFNVSVNNKSPGFPITYEQLTGHLGMEDYTLKMWLHEINSVWKWKNLEDDWRRYLYGEKRIDEFDEKYCFTLLLPDFSTVRTEGNARALSRAIKQEFPKEMIRYTAEDANCF